MSRERLDRPPPKPTATRANSAANESVGRNRDQTPAVNHCQPMSPGRPPSTTHSEPAASSSAANPLHGGHRGVQPVGLISGWRRRCPDAADKPADGVLSGRHRPEHLAPCPHGVRGDSVRTVPKNTGTQGAMSDFAGNSEAGAEDTGPVTIYDIQATDETKVRISTLPRLTRQALRLAWAAGSREFMILTPISSDEPQGVLMKTGLTVRGTHDWHRL